MGSLHAQEFASLVQEEEISLRQALTYQLRSNHYPPVPLSMIDPCIAAIDIVQRSQWGDAESSERVELPAGILYRGEDSAPAWAIVEQHHLSAFIEWED
jgi:hypothetical protein